MCFAVLFSGEGAGVDSVIAWDCTVFKAQEPGKFCILSAGMSVRDV